MMSPLHSDDTPARPRPRGVAASRLVAAVMTMLLFSATAGAAVAQPPIPDDDAQTTCDPSVTQYVPTAAPIIAQLGMAQAWTLTTGHGVTVAVVDSGVAAGNAHLPSTGSSPALLPGIDLVQPGGDGRVDVFGHGTEIAGQIAARPVTGSGVIGLAYAAQILPVRVFVSTSDQDVQAGLGPDPARLAKGISWAADHGAQIIVAAQSTPTDVPALRTAVAHATAKGSLVIAAAGNDSDPGAGAGIPRFPAAYPSVIGVASLDDQGLPAAESASGPQVALAAPGQNVFTTYFAAGDCEVSQTPATSFATGYVAGVAALVAARFPKESPAQWTYRLLVTASRGIAQERDDVVGWGIVDPTAALSFVNDGTASGPDNPDFSAHAQPTPQPATLPPVAAVLPQSAKIAILGFFAAAVVILIAGVLAQRLSRRRHPKKRPHPKKTA